MTSPSSNSEPSHSLPTQLLLLLERKIKARRQEFDRTLSSRQTDIHERLTQRIQEYLPDSAQRPGRVGIFRTTYQEIVALAAELTDKWPEMVWQVLLESIESIEANAEVARQLQALLDQSTWKEASSAFTLTLIDPKRIQSAMDRTLHRYGLEGCKSEAHFQHQRDLATASAEVTIRDVARNSKERVALAIEDFLRKGPDQKSTETDAIRNRQSNEEGAHCSVDECFPNLPKNREKLWVAAICEATSELIAELGHCPNQNQLWARLCATPPASYSIEYKPDRGGEEAIWSGSKSLGKKAFQQRFREYRKDSQSKTRQG